VAGMVVFEKARANKAMYRKYRIRTVSEHDDYAYMSEVLSRRFAKGEEAGPFPDLIVVDGGKGQLNVALSVISDLNLQGSFGVLGIAKKDENRGETRDKIFLPGRANPVNFGREEDLLLFLQRIRDEAHRFAITFHRKRRMKSSMQSVLDGIPGIGKKRKSLLLKHFKSIKKIRAATLDEMSALPGMTMKAAEALHNALSTSKSG
jgi:excinuclease ABC subunit C